MTTLQQRLRDFLGTDQFSKFVSKTQSPLVDHILWWQERAWSQFTSEFPEYQDFDYPKIKASLRICEKHFEPLQKDLVPIRYNVGRHEREEFMNGWIKYPNARPFVFRDKPLLTLKQFPPTEEILFCRVCREHALVDQTVIDTRS